MALRGYLILMMLTWQVLDMAGIFHKLK